MFTKLIARTVNVQLAMKLTCAGEAGASCIRIAARIWLEVTDVRVERLQSITPQDCEAEGVPAEYHGQKSMGIAWKDYEGEVHQIYGIEAMFAGIWTSINDKRPGCRWVDNPMVWA
jgi:hypothetical protein